MKKYTYAQIANDFCLWGEYVDTSGIDTREKFEAMTESEKIAIQVKCFGPESAAESADE